MTPLSTDKDRLRTHIQSLELYNRWELDHPITLSPNLAIATIGYFYHLIPVDERKQPLKIDEIIHIRKIFSKMKARNNRA